MKGIYIHIPFCASACFYCNFHFSTAKKFQKDFVQALKKEIILKKNFFTENTIIDTLYFGGGTPSVLELGDMEDLCSFLHLHFNLKSLKEFTVEANPEDLSLNKLKKFKELGVTRLSIGVQSFNESTLKYLGRQHDGKQALKSIENAQKADFENISIDLIYGVPTQTKAIWQKDLETFYQLNLPHVSCYCLTIEDKTPLALWINQKKIKPVDDDLSVCHYKTMTPIMFQKGYVHYEISNFAKHTYYSKHNLIYWQNGAYLGMGPSAHSYNGSFRSWNISHTSHYINAVNNHDTLTESEKPDKSTLFNEYIFTALRTMWGVKWSKVKTVFGKNYYDYLNKKMRHVQMQHMLEETSEGFRISEKGKLFADKIAAHFFVV